MIYLNSAETIWVDDEITIIFENGKKSKEIGDANRWKLFKILVKNRDKLVGYSDIELAVWGYCSEPGKPRLDVRGVLKELKQELAGIGVLKEITFDNERNVWNRNSRKGGYTMFLPKSNNTSEKVLAGLYWERYESISAQKEGQRKIAELTVNIGEVYQIPIIQDEKNDVEWSVNNTTGFKNNILIEAPNGYGKTTFLRSILLASSYKYRDNLSEAGKKQYEKIKSFHNIDNDMLCLYVECKHISLAQLSNFDDVDWMYDALANTESIRIARFISAEKFSKLIKDYNENKRLIILIDGFDEIEAKYRFELLEKLNIFQKNSEFGCNSKIIMTSRPLFWNIEFADYIKYSISNKNILEDEKTFLNFVDGYSRNYKFDKGKELYGDIKNNYYLRKLVCTPAIIVWLIRQYQVNEEFYVTVERILEQIMLRYNSRELTAYKDQYKRVYEEIAYRFLCLSENEEGLLYYDAEILSLIRSCIEKIATEGDRRFNAVFSIDNRKDEDLGELFVTNVALMEYQNGKIKFSTIVFAYHLAARAVLRCLKIENYKDAIINTLDNIYYTHRYFVMNVAASLALHLTAPNGFFESNGWGEDAIDAGYNIADVFFEYLHNKWNDSECGIDEKECIKEAIAYIVNKSYGENSYTNGKINKDGKYDELFNTIMG